MEIMIIEQNEKGEMLPLRHPEVVELDVGDVSVFSDNKRNRLIGIDKNLYRLSLASYKNVKKELTRRGLLSRFDFSKR